MAEVLDPMTRRRAARGRAGISAAFGVQGFVFAVVLTHLGAFEDAWDLDDLEITIIMFVVAILAAVGSAAAAWISARTSSATALRIGLVLLAVSVGIAAFAPTLAVFCVGLACYGVGLGCVDATTNMQAVACEALQGRSILTSFHATWSAGGILGALETSRTASWGWSLTASLGVAAVAPLIAACAPLLGHGAHGDAAPGTPDTARVPIPWKALSILGVAIVLFYMADSATQSWSTIYLGRGLHASDVVAPLGYALYQGTSLVSRVAGDHAVRRFGAVPVVRCAAGVGAAGLLLAIIAPAPVVAIAGFGILGIGIAVVAPLSFAAAGRLATVDTEGRPVTDPRVRRAAADAIIARVNEFNYLGFVLGGVLTGLVGSASSMQQGFIVPLVGIVLIIPLARAFAARHSTPHAHHSGPQETP